jgi:hypothetical protein
MVTEEKKKVLSLFSEGRRLYKLMQFAEALSFFESALNTDPEDGPSKVYYLRCKHYLENPPAPDWDGVFVMQSK